LGAEQSGHIAELGIETYLKMLEQTVRELKGEAPEEAPSTALELPVIMTIPKDYVRDANLRMGIYRRFGSSKESGEEVLAELRDRFGPSPKAVETLAAVADLKRLAEELRVQSISARRGKLVLRLREDSRVDVDELIRFVSTRPEASFSPSGVLTMPLSSTGESVELARSILEAVRP
jgi:transcription-repair coupling factor (superfamily II helicase)